MERKLRHRLLVTVLTYPHPSRSYQETVCAAGITHDARWVRLYPLPLRSLPSERQLRKWQWIELETLPPANDLRPESRRPVWDSIEIRETWDARRDRELRRRLVHQLRTLSLAQWEDEYERDRTSLGVLVPSRVLDVEAEFESEDWTEQELAKLSQMNLFANARARLQKIPYRFRYVIEDADGRIRRLAIRDWELGELFRKMRDKHGTELAVEKVRAKYLSVCADDKDTRFFVGTMYPLNQWMVLGVFWPPKEPTADSAQQSLFDVTPIGASDSNPSDDVPTPGESGVAPE